MPLPFQAKLLRALERREFIPVGAKEPVRVDVRLVSATNRNLQDEVESTRFRADLYYRIAGAVVAIPPLRERREDIVLLVEHVRRKVAPDVGFTVEAIEGLCLHAWPGNVRELLTAVRWLLLRASTAGAPLVTLAAIVERLGVKGAEEDQDEATRALAALEACGGNVVLASRQSGVPRGRLYRILKKLGRDPEQFRKP